MKKFWILLLALMCLCTSALAQSVVDDADLFTDSEERALAERIEQFRDETGMDFALITTDGAYSGSQQDVADLLYEEGGYGMGADNSGILYWIDMYERVPYLSTTGRMIDIMTDGRIEDAHDAGYKYLTEGEFARAAEAVIDRVEMYVNRGVSEGSYRYDDVTGERLTSGHKAITGMELLVSVGIALAVMLVLVGSINHGYNLKGSTYEYDFRKNGRLDLTDRDDTYLRTTSTRTRKASASDTNGGGHSSNASGVHTSSSGTTHGGGAGKKF